MTGIAVELGCAGGCVAQVPTLMLRAAGAIRGTANGREGRDNGLDNDRIIGIVIGRDNGAAVATKDVVHSVVPALGHLSWTPCLAFAVHLSAGSGVRWRRDARGAGPSSAIWVFPDEGGPRAGGTHSTSNVET
jgi:hypothetical protein